MRNKWRWVASSLVVGLVAANFLIPKPDLGAATPMPFNRADVGRQWAQIQSYTLGASNDSAMYVLIEPLFTAADTTAAASGMNVVELWMVNPQAHVTAWRGVSTNEAGDPPEDFNFRIRRTSMVGLFHDQTTAVPVIISWWRTTNQARNTTLSGTFSQTDQGVRNVTFVIPPAMVMWLPIEADSILIRETSSDVVEMGVIMW